MTTRFEKDQLRKLAVCPSSGTLLVDHSCLMEKGSPNADERVVSLVREATVGLPAAAAICVHPTMVEWAVKCVSDSPLPHTPIAAVINFPNGTGSTLRVLEEARAAVANGATELDLVIDYNLIKRNMQHGFRAAFLLTCAVKNECYDGVLLKVIIESGSLWDTDLIIGASINALRGGADFLKTSTGQVEVNATIEAAETMLHCIAVYSMLQESCNAGFKASGGLAQAEQALPYLEAAERIMGSGWVNRQHFRFGSSRMLGALREAME